MSTVKELAIFFCAVSVMCGAFNLLAGKTLEKSFKYVLALIFLSVMVSAITNLDVNFSIKRNATATKEDQRVIEMSSYQAEYLTGEILNKMNIKYSKISAKANKVEGTGIVINEIIIKDASDVELARTTIIDSGICETVKFE